MSNTTPVMVPHENVNDDSVLLQRWFVENGAKVEALEPIAEVEGSKAAFEIPAPCAGYVRYAMEIGSEIPVGGVLCHICDEADAAVTVTTQALPPSPVEEHHPPARYTGIAAVAEATGDGRHFSAKANALLVERGLDAASLPLTGLIRTRDLLAYLGESVPATTASAATPSVIPHAVSGPVVVNGVTAHTEALPRSKRVESKYLGSAVRNTLASSVTVVVPTRGLHDAMENFPQINKNTSAVIVYEVARLLRQYPLFNACFVDSNAHCYDEVNIGFAIDAGHGLKVPVIRHADTLSMQEIAEALQEMVVRYLNDDLPVESLSGGTFTITDLSGEGVFIFQPMLNQGQSAILGIGGEFFPPDKDSGLFSLTFVFDHQLAEGRTAAQFLNDLRSRLTAYETVGETKDLRCWRCKQPVSELQALGHNLIIEVKADGSTAHLCTRCAMGW